MELEVRHLIEQSRDLIRHGNIEKAIKTLQLVARSFKIKHTEDALADIFSKYYELEIHVMAGTINREFAAVQQNRIIRQLLQMADELESALKNKKFEVELKTGKPIDKKVLDWIGTLFLQPSGK